MKNLMKSASCGNPAKFMWQSKSPGDSDEIKNNRSLKESLGLSSDATSQETMEKLMENNRKKIKKDN